MIAIGKVKGPRVKIIDGIMPHRETERAHTMNYEHYPVFLSKKQDI